MKWSEQTWIAANPVYNKILEHPFIKGLIDGSLEYEKFIFYMQQDALYLAQYGKVMSAIASRLDKAEHQEAFLLFAKDTMMVERALHESYTGQLKTDIKPEASPSCLLYTSYLLRQTASASLEVLAASVLPCFWIYKEVGDYILANQKGGDNPYQNWIDTYGGTGFEESVTIAISICDELAAKCTDEQRQAMTDAFVMCSRLEWQFWDSAWRLEKWAV